MRKKVTKNNLINYWLSGTTCHHKKNSVHWETPDGKWIVMKHHGHSEYINRFTGSVWCGTRYELFKVGDDMPRTLEPSKHWTHEGRWSKKCATEIEQIIQSGALR